MLANVLLLAYAAFAVALPTGETEVARAATVAPDPTQVYVKGLVYGGTGCPQGSVGSYISPDRQTFTLIFDRYVASIGPGVSITDNRKNCQINIDLQYPGGFQYSILSTTFRGYIGIDKGVTAVQGATYYFSGQTAQTKLSTTFYGPQSTDYAILDSNDLTSTIWSPCGAPIALNVDSSVLLRSSVSGASGLITDDSIDGHVKFVAGVQWQKC